MICRDKWQNVRLSLFSLLESQPSVFGKMGRTWKNSVHFEKCGALGKMRRPWKNAAHLEE